MSKEKLVPKLRFKDSKKDFKWKLMKLGDIGDTFNGLSGKSKKDFGHGNAEFVTYMNVFNNTITNVNLTERVEIDNTQNEVQYGDVFFTTSSETPHEVGMSSVWLDSRPNVYLNSFCFGFRPLIKLSPYYLAYMLKSPRIRQEFIFLAQGISRYNISKTKAMEISVWMPNISEQMKIGNFFKKLDQMIQLQQLKVNKVKDIKSAYLSEMFPKEGEKYPKKRFEGFTEPWKKYNLGEIGYTISGVGFPNSEQGGKKGIMFLKVSDMNLSENTTEINTSNNFVTAFQVHKRNWKVIEEVPALIFAKVGAALLLDRKRLVNDKFLIDNNMMAYILGEKLVADFTNALFKKIYLPKYAQIGALPSMNDSIVEKIEVLIPSLEEQEKIGKFFKNLDNQIYIEEEKLTKLEKLKQAYLNDMFV